MFEKMIEMKNVFKNQFLLFKDKQIVFSLLENEQNFKFGRVFDESKTHIFKPIFMYIQGLKVQLNVKLWSLHPDLCFAGI